MSNTGALCTTPLPSRAWSVDWLSYTCHSSRDLEFVDPWYVAEEWLERPSGTNGYSITSEYAKGRLLRSDNLTLGIHADLPGQHLADMRVRFGQRSVPALCEYVLEHGFTLTRLDVAIDEREGLVTYERLRESQSAGALVTRAKTLHWHTKEDSHSGALDGWTCYVGAPSSRLTMRIYDKAAERRAKLGRKATVDPANNAHWVRVELQCRDEAALAVLKVCVDDGMARVQRTFNTVLSVRVPSADSNRRRWPVASWWAETIGSLSSRQLGLEKPAYSLDRARSALMAQYAPTIAALREAETDQLAMLQEANREGKKRLKSKHWRAIAADLGKALELPA